MIRYATTLRRLALAALATLLLAAVPTPARAAFLLTFAQVGGNVVVTGSGTLNTTALTLNHSNEPVGGVAFDLIPNFALALAGSSASDIYTGVSGPTSFGAFIDSNPTSTTGSLAGVEGAASGVLYVPAGYVSGTPITNSATYAGATFSSLGFTPGTYTFTWGTGLNADSATVTSAPEPSTWAVLGVGVAALGVMTLHSRMRRA